jgi:hypothetical protein
MAFDEQSNATFEARIRRLELRGDNWDLVLGDVRKWLNELSIIAESHRRVLEQLAKLCGAELRGESELKQNPKVN